MALRGQMYQLKCIEQEVVTDDGDFLLKVKLPLDDWKRLERQNQINLEQLVVPKQALV
jgi:hypothetical protein